MHYKFPFPISMENIPRQKGICCLSLRFGCVLTAIVVLLYSVIGLAQCSANFSTGFLMTETGESSSLMMGVLVASTLNHSVTFALTAVMLIGVFKKSLVLIKPWVVWCSVQVTVLVMMFIFFMAVSSTNSFADASILVYVVHVLLLMIRIYMVILVGSYYKHLEEGQDETERLSKLIGKEAFYNGSA